MSDQPSQGPFRDRAALGWLLAFIAILATIVMMNGRNATPDAADNVLAAANAAVAEVNSRHARAMRSIELTVTPVTREYGEIYITFVVKNGSNVAVKDVEISCEGIGASGTAIGGNARTIYQTFAAHSEKRIPTFNMGYIDDQARRVSCAVTGLAVE